MIGGLSNRELVSAIETTYYELIAVLQTSNPGGFLRREPDMIIYYSGLRVPLLNGVLGPRFTAENMSRRVESAMSHFKSKRMPMRWILGPSSSPPDLGELLSHQGLKEGWTIPGMALDLGTVGRELLPKGFEIQQVTDKGSLRTCGDTLAEGFGLRDEIGKGVSDAVVSYGMSPTRRWFLGLLNGKAVTVSLLVLHEEFAGIYCVATVPEARGKGLGSAITREPLMAAKTEGYNVAVLEASGMGFPVYKKIGFKQLCEFRTYAWSP
jgi:ribosomal protein S18 acetylase RimI-like enzyme